MQRLALILAVLLSGITLDGVAALTTASVADLSLPAAPYSHTDQSSDGNLLLSVSSDEAGGWNVSLAVSAFVYSGAFAGSNIPAANLSILSVNTPTMVSGQAVDPTAGPKVPASGATGSLSVTRKVIQSDPGFGQGAYTQEIAVRLLIPGQARAGVYSGTLTVTTATGP